MKIRKITYFDSKTLWIGNYVFLLKQNLRDALDNMYDARIPALWRKVRFFCYKQIWLVLTSCLETLQVEMRCLKALGFYYFV